MVSFSIITVIIAIILLSITIFFVYLKTGLWGFTHRVLKKLDEREIILTSKSLRIAYTIFSVGILILMTITSLTNFSLHMVTIAGLILFAHILPASIIAWNEGEV